MNEHDRTTELSRCLLVYGQAVAHSAALETATLLGYKSPYPSSDAEVLLRRAAQDLAAALGAPAEQDRLTPHDP